MLLSDELTLWFLALGILMLFIASALESYWEFGSKAREEFRARIFRTPWKNLILVGWWVLLLAGGAMLMLADVWVGVGAIVVYWLVLPIVIGSRVRKRLLPPWDDLKGELEKEGYTKNTYWRRGDWWKEESKTRRKPDSKSVR